MHKQLFAALDAGDVEAALAHLSPDLNMGRKYTERPCTVALSEIDGLSAHAIGNAASRKLLTDWVRAAGEKASTTRVTRWLSDCFSAELSYAVLEFERTRTVDGERQTRRYVSTSLVTHRGGHWRITNWQVAPAGETTVSVEIPRWPSKGAAKGSGSGYK